MRNFGCASVVDRASEYDCTVARLVAIRRLQIEYSLTERTVEQELIPMAKALNIGCDGVVAAGRRRAEREIPRGSGAGPGAEPGRMSSEMMKGFLPEQQRTERVVTAVKAVAGEVGRSMAQVALAWLSLPGCAGDSDYWGAEVIAVAGQPGEFGAEAFGGAGQEAGPGQQD
jgi:aryl-alcohol dehydrogenase-like predicted oxidoreductase